MNSWDGEKGGGTGWNGKVKKNEEEEGGEEKKKWWYEL